MWYYGVRWKGGCHPDEFWMSYFTSSKVVALYRTLFGDDCWEHEIRRTFNDVKSAREWEHKVLRRTRVKFRQHIWMNKTDNRCPFVEVISIKHRRSSSKLMNHILEMNDHFRGNSNPMFGITSPTKGKSWYNDGIVEDMYLEGDQPVDYVRGRLPCTEAHKQRTSKAAAGRRWINNGFDHLMILNTQPLPAGYAYGRLTPWQ